MTSNEILDHNALRSTVSDPTSRPVLHDQSLVSTCVCLLPIADQLNPIQFTGFMQSRINDTKIYRHI